MSVSGWCVHCRTREENCGKPDSHRAQGLIRWRADYYLGGKRTRPIYAPGITKKEAETFEAIAVADYARGKFIPQVGPKSKALFKDFVETYITDVINQRSVSPRREAAQLNHALRFWGNRPLSSFTEEDGHEYVKKRSEEHVADKRKQVEGLKPRKNLKRVSKYTINRELNALKPLFKWGVENNYLQVSPFVKVKRFKGANIRPRWLSEQEIEALKETAFKLNDPDLADIIEVGIDTGFRDYNLREISSRSISETRVTAFKTKNGKPYDVPLTAALKEKFGRLVIKRGHEKLLNFRNFRKRFERVVKEAGLHRPSGDPDNVTVHVLRHTFAARCLKKGVPIHVVKKWLNHHSIEFTSKHYGHIAPDVEDEMIKKLD